MTELLDIFDADFNKIGVEDRISVHKNGHWHQVFHCWIIRPNNKLLLQLRSIDKDTNPGKLDISCAGHLTSGEAKEDSVRELEEELGLKIDFKDMKYIGYCLTASDNESKKIVPCAVRHFCHTFFLKNDTPLEKLKLQPDELDGIFEIDLDDGRKLFFNEVPSVKIQGFIRKNDNNLEKTERVVTVDNFTHITNIWRKIFNLAEDFNNGRKYINI